MTIPPIVPKHFSFSPELFHLNKKKRVEMRESSKEAYAKIVASGLLVRNQLLCYECVRKIGPCTGSELWQYMEKAGLVPKKTKDRRAWAARPLSKLHQKKCMTMSKKTRPCTVNSDPDGTPVNEHEWSVNANLPGKLQPKISLPKERLLEQALQQARGAYLLVIMWEHKQGVPIDTILARYAPFSHLLRYLSYRVDHLGEGLPKP